LGFLCLDLPSKL
jgi:hypothetical protein